jgi:hypothetical protein
VEVLAEPKSDSNIRQSTISTDKHNNEELPPYLIELFSKSSKNLKQKLKLKQVLLEYQDVVSKHDLDLGCLTLVTHSIETRNEPPVKLKMRRTPLGFQEAEEEKRNKMLEAA